MVKGTSEIEIPELAYLFDPKTPDELFKKPDEVKRAFYLLYKHQAIFEYRFTDLRDAEELDRWQEQEVEPGLFCCQLTTRAGTELKGLVVVDRNVYPDFPGIPPNSRLILPIKAYQERAKPLILSACRHNERFFTGDTDDRTIDKDYNILRGGKKVFDQEGINYGLICSKLENYLEAPFGYESLQGLGPRWSFGLWSPSLRPLTDAPSEALKSPSALRAFLAIKTAEAIINRFNLKEVNVGDKVDFIS